ncbi:MAG: 30S ribosome-binding factor RbfA [Cyclobacteriaceae bacterium]|nr:30S ribosome-binding factor RbfA [Flammeovirgaceae bacterium]
MIDILYFYFMSGTVRQQKYSKLILKELSDIFLKEKTNFLDNAFITVADVRMSPDLSVAKIYLSMTLAKDKQAVLDKINLKKSEIRKALGNKIRNQARIVPQLVFYIDEIEEGAQRIEDIIKNLNIPKEDKN